MAGFDEAVAGIGALAEPTRRELYLYVCAQPAPVTREEAADAIGIARHQAKFHLDRLESEGLLVTEYARPPGRTGPGAGRPAKRYRRAPDEIAVSLPDREYELVGRLMAAAIAESTATGDAAVDVLYRLAAEHGRAIGAAALADSGRPRSVRRATELAVEALSRHGYEPRAEGDRVIMANCPFHALAAEQTDLVCHMNLALITGLTDTLAPHCPRTELEPGAGRCCVVLSAPVE
jgi:predicted ArsR family transcriptional regulator